MSFYWGVSFNFGCGDDAVAKSERGPEVKDTL